MRSSKVYKTNEVSISNAKNERIYINDIIAIDQSFDECHFNAVETINLFQKLSFLIHPDKCKFITAKAVEYLGFIAESEKMVTYLSDKKKTKNLSEILYSSNKTKIDNKRIC